MLQQQVVHTQGAIKQQYSVSTVLEQEVPVQGTRGHGLVQACFLIHSRASPCALLGEEEMSPEALL